MTFTIRTRGAPGLKVAEYCCPIHGRFEATVADVPDVISCDYEIQTFGWPDDGEYRSYNAATDELPPSPRCGLPSPWVISAPSTKNPALAVTATVRGGDTERQPGMLDTRQLAEGMKVEDWKKLQDKGRQERRHKQLIEKGLKTKRVQV